MENPYVEINQEQLFPERARVCLSSLPQCSFFRIENVIPVCMVVRHCSDGVTEVNVGGRIWVVDSDEIVFPESNHLPF